MYEFTRKPYCQNSQMGMSKHIEQQKIHISKLQEQELRLVGVREKLSRFIEAI